MLFLQEGSVLPVSWNTLPSQSSAFKEEEEKDEIEGGVWVEEDDEVDLPHPPGPPPPLTQDLQQPSPSLFSGVLGTLSEAWGLTTDIRTEVDITFSNPTSVINIKCC